MSFMTLKNVWAKALAKHFQKKIHDSNWQRMWLSRMSLIKSLQKRKTLKAKIHLAQNVSMIKDNMKLGVKYMRNACL